MLLRRFIEHVKAQNWTAVALDFVIVVSGVFIGIQVANWNESRQFDHRERELLNALRAEVEGAIVATNEKIYALEQVGAAGARSLEFLERSEACAQDCWRVVVDFIHASQWQNVWVSRSTYDEMRRIGLPRSRTVIDAVEAYHAQNASLAVTLEYSPAYRELVRGLAPLQLQDVYWTQCYHVENGVESYSLDCTTNIDEEVSRATVEAIVAHPEIAPKLTAWTAYVRAMPPTLRGQIRAAERAIALIDEELGRS